MYRIYRLKHREREREREISSCNKLNNDVPCYNLIVLFEIDLSKQIERESKKRGREMA